MPSSMECVILSQSIADFPKMNIKLIRIEIETESGKHMSSRLTKGHLSTGTVFSVPEDNELISYLITSYFNNLASSHASLECE